MQYAVPFRPWAIIIRQLHKEFAAATAIPLSEEKRRKKFDSRLKLGKERGGNSECKMRERQKYQNREKLPLNLAKAISNAINSTIRGGKLGVKIG